jgi:hypothetical protein
MDNPYLDRARRIGEHGRRSEKRLANRLGGKLIPASGSTRAKGDMVLGDFLIEAKATSRDSLSLKHDWLAKIDREALATGRKPALAVSFVRPDGTQIRGGTWIAIPEDVFKELIDA